MRAWDPERVAAAAGARLATAVRVGAGGATPAGPPGPGRVVIDSRRLREGDLFVGLPGGREHGGAHAGAALAAGAWGVLVDPAHADALAADDGTILVARDPLRALQRLAREWRRALGARVVAITGSTGKTSTKDILAALLRPHRRTVASPENLNTEIGLPLVILDAPPGTEALVLEMGMRGPGQIAELAAIAEPDVGVIVSIGPVHLELLGSIEAIAAAKAELLDGLSPGATAVVPAGERRLDPHRRPDLRTVTFGAGGDVSLDEGPDGHGLVRIGMKGEPSITLVPSFSQPHQLNNLLAAVAAARALGIVPEGRLEVAFSAGRGERIELASGVTLLNDCYNANPMSMRAALDELARTAPGRRVAVLGDMLELGPDELDYHREIGAHAARRGVDVLVTVGPRAAAMGERFPGETHRLDDRETAAAVVPGLLRPGDTVLVKASLGVGLASVAEALVASGGAP